MSDHFEKPCYVRDSEWQIARSLGNLWLWANLMECGTLPKKTEYTIYLKQLAMQGPRDADGRKIVITIQLEDSEIIP